MGQNRTKSEEIEQSPAKSGKIQPAKRSPNESSEPCPRGAAGSQVKMVAAAGRLDKRLRELVCGQAISWRPAHSGPRDGQTNKQTNERTHRHTRAPHKDRHTWRGPATRLECSQCSQSVHSVQRRPVEVDFVTHRWASCDTLSPGATLLILVHFLRPFPVGPLGRLARRAAR